MFDKNIDINGRKYYSFDYREECSINEQVENFLTFHLNRSNDNKAIPLGILFLTPCQVNITARFNLSNE